MSSGGRAIQGRGDLLADMAEKKVRLEEVSEKELPENLRKMTAEERKAYVQEQQKKRDEINTQMAKLSRQRSDYIEAEKRKSAKPGSSFDEQVAQIVKEQADRKLKTK